MYTNIKYIVSIFILCLISYACSNEENEAISEDEVVRNGLQLKFGEVSDNIRNYTDIYVFNGEGAKANFYKYKIYDVARVGNNLKMDVLAGKWNIVLVGCNELDIRQKLIQPAVPTPKERKDLPMWQTVNVGNNLPDVPEIRTALINGIQIVKDQNHNAQASLERNVAKVRVVLADGVGFKIGGGHTVSLKNVPTTLAWDGSLYPGRDIPTITSYPMTKSATFSASTIQGHQKSDTIDFIIPAHRSTSPTDISTHKITLGVDFITAGGVSFKKDVVLQTVPKNNKILLVNVTAKGGVEVAIDIKDWETVVSTNNLDMYSLTSDSNTGTIATFKMNMKQERNWWVTLEDPVNFEFVDGSSSFGQLTTTPVNIQVKRKTAGAAMSTKLNLYISGFDNLREQYNVTNLTR